MPNLWLLPCGAMPPNPAELLHAERFKRIVDELAAHYDRVIFDSPPVGAVTDAAILARLTDGTVLVAKGGAPRATRSRAPVRRSPAKASTSSAASSTTSTYRNAAANGYYYYSRYGYDYRDEEQAPASASE